MRGASSDTLLPFEATWHPAPHISSSLPSPVSPMTFQRKLSDNAEKLERVMTEYMAAQDHAIALSDEKEVIEREYVDKLKRQEREYAGMQARYFALMMEKEQLEGSVKQVSSELLDTQERVATMAATHAFELGKRREEHAERMLSLEPESARSERVRSRSPRTPSPTTPSSPVSARARVLFGTSPSPSQLGFDGGDGAATPTPTAFDLESVNTVLKASRDETVKAMESAATDAHTWYRSLEAELGRRTGEAEALRTELTDREGSISNLTGQLKALRADRDNASSKYGQDLLVKGEEISALTEQLLKLRGVQDERMRAVVARHDETLAKLEAVEEAAAAAEAAHVKAEAELRRERDATHERDDRLRALERKRDETLAQVSGRGVHCCNFTNLHADFFYLYSCVDGLNTCRSKPSAISLRLPLHTTHLS